MSAWSHARAIRWGVSLYPIDSPARLKWLDDKLLVPLQGYVMHSSMYLYRLNELPVRNWVINFDDSATILLPAQDIFDTALASLW